MAKAKKEKVLEEKAADLIGADAISRHVGRDYVSWAKWRKFGFPARKVHGAWEAVSGEVDEWLKKAGGEAGVKVISEERLWIEHVYRPYLEARRGARPVRGWQEIEKLYGFTATQTSTYMKENIGFPVVKEKREPVVDDSEMRLWLLDRRRRVILHPEDRFPEPSPI